MRNRCLYAVAAIVVLVCSAEGSVEDHPILAHLRKVGKEIHTIDISVDMQTQVGHKGSRFHTTRRWRIDDGANRHRVQVWEVAEGGGRELLQDQTYREGVLTDYAPSKGRAEIRQIGSRVVVPDEMLLPFFMGRIMKLGSVAHIEESEDSVEICWDVPEGQAYERRITVRFAKNPPYDILSATFATDEGQTTKEATFHDYRPVGDGLRLPGRTSAVYEGSGSRPDMTIDTTPRSVVVNRDIPDCEFVADIAHGTVVNDLVSGTSYVVGERIDSSPPLDEVSLPSAADEPSDGSAQRPPASEKETIAGVDASADNALGLGQACQPASAPATIKSMLPHPVAELMDWPAPAIMVSKAVKPDSGIRTDAARRTSLKWIKKVIGDDWLPKKQHELDRRLAFLRDAYPGYDTTHVQWERNGYRFRVSQTKVVFSVQISALSGPVVPGDTAVNKQAASRAITWKILNNTTKARSYRGAKNLRKLAPAGTKAMLMEMCFDKAIVREAADGLVGRPAPPQPRTQDPAKLDRARFGHWWRRMGWWTDGDRLCLFTLKTEGGAWRANYGDAAKGFRRWFDDSPEVKESPAALPSRQISPALHRKGLPAHACDQ